MPHSKLTKLLPIGIRVPTRTTPLVLFMYIAYVKNPHVAAPAVVATMHLYYYTLAKYVQFIYVLWC